MNQLRELLPLLWPLIAIQVGLMIFALLDLSRRSVTRGPKWVWALVIIFINLIGPIVYFVIGRDEG
jgi:hypothetical protein